MAPIADPPKKAKLGEDGLTKHQRYYQWYGAIHLSSIVCNLSNAPHTDILRLKKRTMSVGVNGVHNC
jgi:hypothetical protein